MKQITITDLLMFEEGYREFPYHCSEGYPTIGIGTKIGPNNAPLSNYTFKVSEKVAGAMLEDELYSVRQSLLKFRWYVELDEHRQIIVKSMAYQMGVNGVLKFKKMIAALESKDYSEASRQALDSRWARQTPARAERHAAVLGWGNLNEVYEGLI